MSIVETGFLYAALLPFLVLLSFQEEEREEDVDLGPLFNFIEYHSSHDLACRVSLAYIHR